MPEAIGRLVRRVGEWTYANEQPLRTLLRLSLDPETGVHRPGHRREWIAHALVPVRSRIDPQTYNKLTRALALLLGIDPVVVMKDIVGASRIEALDTLEWTASSKGPLTQSLILAKSLEIYSAFHGRRSRGTCIAWAQLLNALLSSWKSANRAQ